MKDNQHKFKTFNATVNEGKPSAYFVNEKDLSDKDTMKERIKETNSVPFPSSDIKAANTTTSPPDVADAANMSPFNTMMSRIDQLKARSNGF